MRSAAVLLAMLLAGCAGAPAPVASPPPAKAPGSDAAAASALPPQVQYLFGSAEAAVAMRVTNARIAGYGAWRVRERPRDSVVLAADAPVEAPRFVPCGDKPYAAIFDADETLIWNKGPMVYFAERGIPFDPAVWDKWEKSGAGKAVAMPGAVEMLAALRAAGITIIVNSNRAAANAKGSEETLRAAGLGDFRHGETLFLMGDDADGSGKDGRRATIAGRYCVIIMAGDQLGDFSQQFNGKTLPPAERMRLATSAGASALWDMGWFLFPNPTYGPWTGLGRADIISTDNEWEPR